MAVVKKKVAEKEATKAVATKKVVAKKAEAPAVAKKVVAKKAEAPAKASVAKKSVAKASVAKKSVAKAAPKKEVAKGGKKLKSSNKTSNSFVITPGKQATQDAFLHLFFGKLKALGYDEVTKEQARQIQKAYSETLKEVTDIASFQDTTANIYYARRIIDTRVTQPPKAADGLQTLMLKHPELKVRKLLADVDEIKFFGHVSEDDPSVFITVDGDEIDINAEFEEKEAVEVADEEEVTDDVVEEEEDAEADEAEAELEEEDEEESDEDEESLFDEEDEEE